MREILSAALAMGLLAGCAGAEATRTSANTVLIDAGAAPACGPAGAARVAARSAGIETLKAGYDRYIIASGNSQNNVSVYQGPGSAQTFGRVSGGTLTATTTYTPGPTIVAGSHDRSLSVVMFRNGEPGAERALDARAQLGPDWQEKVKNPILTCLG